MTRPEEPLDDHTLPSPGDPWAAADQPGPTVNLGSPTTYLGGAAAPLDRPATRPGDPAASGDATTRLGHPSPQSGQPTAHLDGATAYFGQPASQPGQPTARLDRSDARPGQPTAHLRRPDARPGQPAAHLGRSDAQPGQPTVPSGQPTAHLGDATAYFGQPTAQLGQPTVHLDGAYFGQPTARPGDGSGHGGGPSAHLDDPGRTVGIGSTDRTVHLSGPDPVVPATVHGGRSAPTVHPDDSTPTVRAHNELRFGPGVPATPMAAPAWPGGATAERSRPLWRRLVSLISTLLTLALIGVVGFYIWQRLSPLEVEGVTVAVPQPAGSRCDTTVDVVATVRTNGRSGVIRYQWFRSDAPPGAVLTEQVGSGQRTAALTLKWTFSGVGTATETATINIIEPSPLQVGTQVAYRCRG
ncbi:hypothetical protein Axi01nite_23970 [Actinoplanes xinjiangensis]|nr:hypothetical protein Axi01nite_23970 [Actinoplanes xinjiangensis]